MVLLAADPVIDKATLSVERVEVPSLRRGEVLVQMAAAPINPSDYGLWTAPKRVEGPQPLGTEGSGKVIASGGGYFANRLLGRDVAVVGVHTYAEYCVVNALKGAVFELPAGVTVEDGCTFFINPVTVVGIVDTVRRHREKVFIHTAAASQLGQMMVKFCQREGITVVNVVRKEEQAQRLRLLGAEHVVVTNADGWEAELGRLVEDLRIKIAFDAVSGNMSGTLLSLLPPGGAVWIYGRLAAEPAGNFRTTDLIYSGKKIHGFIVSNWLGTRSTIGKLWRLSKAARLVRKYPEIFFDTDFRETSMQDLHQDFCAFRREGVTGSKMRLNPVVDFST